MLAEDIYSPLDMPAFPQSAMDGYALNFASLEPGVPLPVTHIIQAGATELPVLRPGEAMRIFTGAPVPEGADTVVMQEKTEARDGFVRVLDADLKPGANVRPVASQTAKGELAAKAGTRLGPGSLGLLASLGVADVTVFANPSTGILVTGKELVEPGRELALGQVYESNSITLRAALAEAGITPQLVQRVDDEADQTFEAISAGLASCQLLLITGGISVGDYDFVHGALERAGVETVFYKIKQKPGKPIYLGKKGDSLVFGLPGNPASVLSCFYQYVVPCIRKMKGLAPNTESTMLRNLSADFRKKPGLTHFMKGKLDGGYVQVLHSQESYKMNAFTEADCLVELEEEKELFRQDESVRVYPLNQLWL